jgi:hypothetical protein
MSLEIADNEVGHGSDHGIRILLRQLAEVTAEFDPHGSRHGYALLSESRKSSIAGCGLRLGLWC